MDMLLGGAAVAAGATVGVLATMSGWGIGVIAGAALIAAGVGKVTGHGEAR